MRLWIGLVAGLWACGAPSAGEGDGAEREPAALGVVEVDWLRDDSNGNGTLNPGETGSLVFRLKNDGGTDVGRVTFGVRVSTQGVAWKGADGADYGTEPLVAEQGDCFAGDVCRTGSTELQVRVEPTFPLDSSLTVELFDLTDEAGMRHPDLSFAVPVVDSGAALAIVEVDWVRSDSGGDGALNPGETATLSFRLTNAGETYVERMDFSVRVTSALVTWKSPDVSDYGTEPLVAQQGACAVGDVCRSGSTELDIRIEPTFPAGTSLTVELFDLVDELGRSHPNLSLSIPVGG